MTDAGNDSIENIKILIKQETKVDYIIKRNLRKESPKGWLQIARNRGKLIKVREGKDIYYGDTYFRHPDIESPLRVIFKVTVETIDESGQMRVMPEIEASTYYTSLLEEEPEVIEALYAEHGTSEQFHSELKSDMDLERLPSGKFETNDLILHFGILAYNILRIIGQESLKGNDALILKKAQRRRIRKVIQNLITIASRVIFHANRFKLGLSRDEPWFRSFRRIYQAFAFGN